VPSFSFLVRGSRCPLLPKLRAIAGVRGHRSPSRVATPCPVQEAGLAEPREACGAGAGDWRDWLRGKEGAEVQRGWGKPGVKPGWVGFFEYDCDSFVVLFF